MIPYFVFNQFNFGPLTLHVWGLMVGLGFTAGYFLFLYLARDKNLPPLKVAGLAMAVFFGAVLGARLLFLLQTPQRFLADINLLWDINSGAMFLGGLLGGVFFGWLYISWVKWDVWAIADLMVLPLCLGIGIGRLGCFLINDHLGAPTSLPWGILWPDGIIRHPVALYESLVGFLLFGVFWWLWQKVESGQRGPVNKPGQLFLLFLLSSSFIRFFLDFTRTTDGYLADPRFGMLTTSQLLGLIIFFAALFLWQKIKSSPKNPPP